MAERRMIAIKLIDSDTFLDMPSSAQALYFHLAMRADDDGFLGNPKRIRKDIGAAEDDLKLLIAKGYILPFESGVIVITHWRIHNYLRQDRYKPTIHTKEKEQLVLEDNVYRQRGSYETNIKPVQNSDSIESGIPNGNHMAAQWLPRLGKDKLNQESLSNDDSEKEENMFKALKKSKEKVKNFIPPTLNEIESYIEEAGIKKVIAEHFYAHYSDPAINWHDSKNKPIKNWKLTVRTWDRNSRYSFSPASKTKTDSKIQKNKERYMGGEEKYEGPVIEDEELPF